MNGCILFASHIPNPSRLYVGSESLDKFVESFSDYDIYVGVNNSCNEWIETLESYKDKLNIFYEITPNELLDTSGGAAYQTTIRMVRESGKKYDMYWFGHTKGATSSSDDFRDDMFNIFWNKKDEIESTMVDSDISLYTPYLIIERLENYVENNLSPLLKSDNIVNELCSVYSFWVLSGNVMNYFIENCPNYFFNTNLLSMKGSNGVNYNRYFFETEFPMIYQKTPHSQRLLYHKFNPNGLLRGRTLEEIDNNTQKINF
jgi:hypothetical protein